MARRLLVAAVLAASLVPAAQASGARGELLLASRAEGLDGAAADAASGVARIDATGRFVAFQSDANNLSDADADMVSDVFLRDMATGATTLVSRGDGSSPGGDAGSNNPVISDGGGVVVFESSAGNLGVPAGSFPHLFARDLESGLTTVVAASDGFSGSASISADGRYVAFTSAGDDLSTEDDNMYTDVFVRDRQTGGLEFVSRATGAAGEEGHQNSGNPAISADGRFVAFQSADALGTDATGSYMHVFVRDVVNDTTTLVSRTSDGTPANEGATSATISGDGRFVAFGSIAANLSDADVDPIEDIFVRDVVGGNDRAHQPRQRGRRTGRRQAIGHAGTVARRALRRLRVRRRQPRRRCRRRDRRLRPRPAGQHDHARQPCARRRWCSRRRRLVHVRPQHLG